MPPPAVVIPIPLRSPRERRGDERFAAAMPMTVDGHAGTTQDLSAGGLSFVTATPCTPGAHVEVVIEYLLDGHCYPLRCEAEVVRVDACEGGYRVGARLVPRTGVEPVPVGEGTVPPLRSVD